MRKVIKGKLYDTDKATAIHEQDNGTLPTDLTYCREVLYRKRTGEYFLHGTGGAMSKYSRAVGYDRYGTGEAIVPLGYEGARGWMERNADTDAYEAEFGVPDEGAEHDLHVIISETAWQAISRAAATEGVSVRTVVERMAEGL